MNRVLWGALLGSFFVHILVIVGFSSLLSDSTVQHGSLSRDYRVEIHLVDSLVYEQQEIDRSVNVKESPDSKVASSELQNDSPKNIPIPIRAKVLDIPTLPLPSDTLNMGGEVVVEFNISTRGAPFNIKVISASPPGFFEDWAIDSIKQGRYQPGVSDTEIFHIRFIIEAGVASQR
jgi:hypothetical protein